LNQKKEEDFAMTLSTAAALAGCFSSLAVVTSLMFAIHQMHRGIRHQQAAARHGRVQQLQSLYVQASQGDFIDVVVRGLAGDASMHGKEANRFVWFSVTIFNMFEDMFEQHRDRIINKATFASSVSALRTQLAMPGMRAAWLVIRGQYEKHYVEYVDRLMADTPTEGTADLGSVWRKVVSATAST
jgi:hypothetical protein